MNPESETKELGRNLRPWDVWAMAFGSIVGFGAFVLPGTWINEAGPIGASLGLMGGALAAVIISQSFGYLSSRYPETGGAFVYTHDRFGPTHGFICGWMLVLGYAVIVPLNATGLAVMARYLAPDFFTGVHLFRIAGNSVYLGEVILSSLAILIIAIAGLRGTAATGRLQVFMVILLAASIALLALGSGVHPTSSIQNLKPHFSDRTPIIAALSIAAIAPWAYVGFDTVPQAVEEIRFGTRRLRSLMVAAILIGCVAYVLVVIASAIYQPSQSATPDSDTWLTGAAMEATLGTVGIVILTIGVSMAIGSGINGFLFASSRLLVSMGRRSVLPRWFSSVDRRSETPLNASLFITGVALLSLWFGRQVIVWFVEMSAVGIALAYAYTCAVALVDSSESPGGMRVLYGTGAVLSSGFLVLLCIPGMPGSLQTPSWILLGVWASLGALLRLFSHTRRGGSDG